MQAEICGECGQNQRTRLIDRADADAVVLIVDVLAAVEIEALYDASVAVEILQASSRRCSTRPFKKQDQNQNQNNRPVSNAIQLDLVLTSTSELTLHFAIDLSDYQRVVVRIAFCLGHHVKIHRSDVSSSLVEFQINWTTSWLPIKSVNVLFYSSNCTN